MKFLDIENWPRRYHYSYFKRLDYPHFNISANLTITHFLDFIKSNDLSFFKTFIYLTAKTANDIKNFDIEFEISVNIFAFFCVDYFLYWEGSNLSNLFPCI